MSWRRATAVSASLFLLATTTVGARAATIDPGTASARVTHGNVALTLTTRPADLERDYTVVFTGKVAGLGWTYQGSLRGTGTTWSYDSSVANTPILVMTSDDGTVSGRCVGTSPTADVSTDSANGMTFGCVLARDGGTPWQVSFDSALTQTSGDANDGTWSGRYAEQVVTVPQVGVRPLGYGQVQIGNATSDGLIQYGPLRLSGSIPLGTTTYVGDLVSGVGPWVQTPFIPPLNVSGSSNGVTVSGNCYGRPDETASGYQLVCDLSANSAAPVTVILRTVLLDSIGGCSYRDCWGDSAGWFTTPDVGGNHR